MTTKRYEPGDPLSPREMDVLIALARGGAAKTVAEDVGMSYQTLKNHLTSAYRKLDCGSLVGAYRALGWLEVAA